MAAQLPRSFTERMKELLGPEYADFAETYNETPHTGIRVNTLKISATALPGLLPFPVEPIPWCGTGFYTEEGARPGKHPYYHAGLYYIQEPSAMSPVELLGVTPGDHVLDLCAAPGGKSTQIAAKLQGKGLLVSNDLNAERTKALAKNLELAGVRNAIVLNESPERIAAAFRHGFDRILIDAPCSGEGMFRKDEDMVRQWNEQSPRKYADMQREILAAAALALKPGGTIVYSTCTFSPEENEGGIFEFLSAHREFEVVPVGGTGSFSPGFDPVPGAARLWPHKVKGEGHFIAVLKHSGTEGANAVASASAADVESAADRRGRALASAPPRSGGGRGRDTGGSGPARRDKTPAWRGAAAGRSSSGHGDARRSGAAAGGDGLAAYGAFLRDQLAREPEGFPVWFGEHLYLSPLPGEALNGLKTVRPGWYMGQIRSGRFVPGHPLATALTPEECLRSLQLDGDGPEAVSYLKGETLSVPAERLNVAPGASPKGYVLVCVDGYSLGWGKWQDGMLKNEYPAGWRWT
ncbi:Ribosomal RNA small subunit methyltransferase F [compost metagenome]